MSLVTPYIENLKRIERDLDTVAKEIIKDNVNTILLIVKKRQLGLGLDSHGHDIVHPEANTTHYSVVTQEYWAKQNPKPRRSKRAGSKFNMEWTGETMDKMYLAFTTDDAYEISSASGKAKYLESIYGEIFNLTEKHNKLINETIIKPQLYEYILKNMFRIN